MGLKTTLERAALSAARAFAGGAVVAFTSFSYVPDVSNTYALALAVAVGGATAVAKLIQIWIPKLSFAGLFPNANKTVTGLADSFTRAFLGSFVVYVIGVLEAVNLSISEAALVAALTAALTAGVRAAQGFLSSGEGPAEGTVSL